MEKEGPENPKSRRSPRRGVKLIEESARRRRTRRMLTDLHLTARAHEGAAGVDVWLKDIAASANATHVRGLQPLSALLVVKFRQQMMARDAYRR